MLLRVEDLHAQYVGRGGAPGVDALRGVSFELGAGEILGLVGESGCGKSATALAVGRLLEPAGQITRGRVLFNGEDLAAAPEVSLRALRGKRIAFVFQDPFTALNPVLTIGTQLVETIRAHESVGARDAASAAREWLARVGIGEPDLRMRQYPHELSGGMRQRVMIAMAFLLRPALLIADEPTTALDVTVQAQVFDLLDTVRRESASAVILISHDMAVVAERCDRVAVMYAGRIVESGPTAAVFDSPRHPYTRALLAATANPDQPARDEPLVGLAGAAPSLVAGSIPRGCAFAARCAESADRCRSVDPDETMSKGGRTIRCLVHAEGVVDCEKTEGRNKETYDSVAPAGRRESA